MNKLLCTLIVIVLAVLPCQTGLAQTYSMTDYTAYPPFINQTVPPLVMILMSKDHRMFIKGYNDLQDLDNNSSTGVNGVENTYADYIDYYGYFDPAKCYTWTGSNPNGQFQPVALATPSGGFRYTCSGKWSGNFLNWATMSRIDIVRKVLYGGARGQDNSGATTPTTTLVRTWLPNDVHSWAKAYKSGLGGGPTVAQLTPKTGVDSITLCNTNSAEYGTQTIGQVWVVTGNSTASPPTGYYPYAASTESGGGGQCAKTANNGGSYTPASSDKYNVEVQVCVSGLLEANCDQYQSGGTSWWKPTGLMQRMGLNRQGTPANIADDTVNMKFALISGSYGAHAAGGILRNKIVDVTNEIDSSLGTVKSTSQIIKAINAIRIRQFSWSSRWYDGDSAGTASGGNCNASASAVGYTLSDDGNCISWGNPMGEMFYEAVRYFMGKTPNTPIFKQATPDRGYVTTPTTDPNYLPVQTWNASVDPYSYCPYCSKAFILTMSEAFPSYDSDHLPGAYGWPTPPAAPTDPLTTDDTGFNVQNFLNAYPNAANSIQGLDGQSTVFVGQSGSTYDKACTSKAGNFVSMRGLCPDEPTKQGSYYIAGLAYKANTTDLRASLTGDTTNMKQNVTTYAVVTNSPFPILEYTINGKKVQIVPTFHDDCPPSSSPVYSNAPAYAGCTSPSYTLADGSDGSGGEMVDFQVCDVNDETANGYEYCYDIMWDDAEYGWDYDLDVRYRLYVDVNPTTKQPCNTLPKPSGCPNSLSTSFGNAPSSGTIRVKTKALYAAAGHTDFAGYLINGVSTEVWTGSSAQAEGEYYDIRCGGSAGFSDCDAYNVNDSGAGTNTMNDAVVVRDFIVNGSTADQLKDPFWYAAKYGGFKDLNGNNIPDNGSTSTPGPCTTTPGSSCEWDNNLDGVPDTYFYAANPLRLEVQLANAFASILNKVSSGTAASVLASSTNGQGATYQSYFFASALDAEREVKWIGYTQSVFVDAFGNLREDTNGDGKLIYTDDRIIVTRFDPTTNTVVVDKYNSNANGQATGAAVVSGVALTAVKSIWEGGSKLAQTSSSARNLWTWVDRNGDKKVSGSAELIQFNSANLTAITPYLRADAVAPYTAANIMDFIRGCDPYATGTTCAGLSSLRDRRITVNGSLQVWKLGDPVNSTPVIVGAPRDRFDVIYGDKGYQQFYQRWRNRRQVLYVGANDGMLHAFNVGYYQQEVPGVHHGCFTQNQTDDCTTQTAISPSLGNELWGFIPQELLPQLRWLADPGYTHVYYVDLKPKVVDARIFVDDGPTGTHPGGWGTILIGGFRMGGSCGNCPGPGNGKDMYYTTDFGNGVETRHFNSAYFVLDITDPDSNPKLLWSFSDPNLGLTTSFPGVANVKDSSGNQKWFALFGSGPTSYDAGVSQVAKLFIVDLANGPVTSPVTTIDASGGGSSPPSGFMGDIVTVDRFLNFTDDAAYAGQVISTSPWQGKLLRLTTGCVTGTCKTNPNQWGVPGLNAPSEVLYQFTDRTGSTRTLGPIPTAPGLSTDDSDNLWVFAGSGRYYTQGVGGDKTDTSQQYLFGVKDWVMQGGGGCTESSRTNCSLGFAPNDLVDTSLAQICIPGRGTCGTTTNQVTGVTVGGTTVNTFANLVSMVQSKKGWVAALTTSSTGGPSERVSASPAVEGGVVFFPTLIPSSDPCIAAGNSSEYALYYLTGSAYSSPVVGTSGTANMIVNNKVDLGQGLATTVALHIGAAGTGTAGGSNTGGGCQSGVVGYVQSSTGTLNSFCGNLGGVTSRYISWNNERL